MLSARLLTLNLISALSGAGQGSARPGEASSIRRFEDAAWGAGVIAPGLWVAAGRLGK